MARCGCSGTCSCVVQGVSPIQVTGNGSVQQPIRVSLALGGKTGCAAIVACLSGNLGPGLVYNEGTGDLQVKLSTQAGNALAFQTDGLYAPSGGTPPTPATCLQTVADLPPAPNTVGAWTLAMLRGPYSAPYMVDWCLSAGSDIIHFRCATSADDVAVVTDYDTHRIDETRTNVYLGQEIRQMPSAVCSQAVNYAGDEDDPQNYGPPGRVTKDQRRGGWYGYLMPKYQQPLLTDFLSKIDGKSVALIDCVPGDTVPYPESLAITGPIRAIQQYCAQAWTMIGVSTVNNALTVKNAGITPVMMARWPAEYGATALPYPVADLQAAGVEWLVLGSKYADSVFTTYRDAGIQVLMQSNSRHSDRLRVQGLSIRGALCHDPVYYRGPEAGDWPFGYRTETGAWEQRKIATGQLTHRTDNMNAVHSGGLVRGLPRQTEAGLFLPRNFGGGMGRPSVLAGWLCPLVNPNNYVLTWEMKWTELAAASSVRAKMGLLFGAPQDKDTLEWPQNNPSLNPEKWPDPPRNMYRAYLRQNGELGIAKWTPTSFSYLATASTPAVTSNVWNSYTLQVTPTQITFTRTRENGQKYTVTAADSTYRGGYVWVEKEEGLATDVANPFGGAFRSLSYTSLG